MEVVKFSRPPNAFVLFAGEKRSAIEEENPHLAMIEVQKMLSAMWKELGEEGREPYKQRAREMLQEFKKQNPDWHYNRSKKPSKQSRVDVSDINSQFSSNPFFLQQVSAYADKLESDCGKEK